MAPKSPPADRHYDPKEHTQNDVVLIAIMGITGSGKSAFINFASGSKLPVSAGLASCTQEVITSPEFSLDGRTVKLIDTPGFDDTSRSEVDILKDIAGFLEKQYGNKIILQGVIYMHRITDIRMGGISTRSFNLFRKLCGETTLGNVVIVTSMWDKLDIKEAKERELELTTGEKFFKPALDKGAKTARHNNTKESTQDIIRAIFPNTPAPLVIQRELVDQRMSIQDTQAGKEVEENLKKLQQEANSKLIELESEIAKIRQHNEEDRKGLQQEIDGLKEKVAKYERGLKSLLGLDGTKLQERVRESKPNPPNRGGVPPPSQLTDKIKPPALSTPAAPPSNVRFKKNPRSEIDEEPDKVPLPSIPLPSGVLFSKNLESKPNPPNRGGVSSPSQLIDDTKPRASLTSAGLPSSVSSNKNPESEHKNVDEKFDKARISPGPPPSRSSSSGVPSSKGPGSGPNLPNGEGVPSPVQPTDKTKLQPSPGSASSPSTVSSNKNPDSEHGNIDEKPNKGEIFPGPLTSALSNIPSSKSLGPRFNPPNREGVPSPSQQADKTKPQALSNSAGSPSSVDSNKNPKSEIDEKPDKVSLPSIPSPSGVLFSKNPESKSNPPNEEGFPSPLQPTPTDETKPQSPPSLAGSLSSLPSNKNSKSEYRHIDEKPDKGPLPSTFSPTIIPSNKSLRPKPDPPNREEVPSPSQPTDSTKPQASPTLASSPGNVPSNKNLESEYEHIHEKRDEGRVSPGVQPSTPSPSGVPSNKNLRSKLNPDLESLSSPVVDDTKQQERVRGSSPPLTASPSNKNPKSKPNQPNREEVPSLPQPTDETKPQASPTLAGSPSSVPSNKNPKPEYGHIHEKRDEGRVPSTPSPSGVPSSKSPGSKLNPQNREGAPSLSHSTDKTKPQTSQNLASSPSSVGSNKNLDSEHKNIDEKPDKARISPGLPPSTPLPSDVPPSKGPGPEPKPPNGEGVLSFSQQTDKTESQSSSSSAGSPNSADSNKNPRSEYGQMDEKLDKILPALTPSSSGVPSGIESKLNPPNREGAPSPSQPVDKTKPQASPNSASSPSSVNPDSEHRSIDEKPDKGRISPSPPPSTPSPSDVPSSKGPESEPNSPNKEGVPSLSQPTNKTKPQASPTLISSPNSVPLNKNPESEDGHIHEKRDEGRVSPSQRPSTPSPSPNGVSSSKGLESKPNLPNEEGVPSPSQPTNETKPQASLTLAGSPSSVPPNKNPTSEYRHTNEKLNKIPSKQSPGSKSKLNPPNGEGAPSRSQLTPGDSGSGGSPQKKSCWQRFKSFSRKYCCCCCDDNS